MRGQKKVEVLSLACERIYTCSVVIADVCDELRVFRYSLMVVLSFFGEETPDPYNS